ncbi:unnamed protein product [Lupinus luteus]|uniref:Uncharacterized protein n=1 Tax=Lupinus luteus TaxID=3873 RepID=A0AAV1XSF7_LUPLU
MGVSPIGSRATFRDEGFVNLSGLDDVVGGVGGCVLVRILVSMGDEMSQTMGLVSVEHQDVERELRLWGAVDVERDSKLQGVGLRVFRSGLDV